jgi:hypothetical protein
MSEAVAHVIKHAMSLLGIRVPERMWFEIFSATRCG